MPPANSLAFEDNPSDNSLIYVKNNYQPSIEPWGKPALTHTIPWPCYLDF